MGETSHSKVTSKHRLVTRSRSDYKVNRIPPILMCLAFLNVAATSAQTFAFRTNARLVTVNVTVRDNKGAVRGLTKDDFVLQDRGKNQTIRCEWFFCRVPAAPARGHFQPPEQQRRAVSVCHCDPF
jgi:hypothetical protein